MCTEEAFPNDDPIKEINHTLGQMQSAVLNKGLCADQLRLSDEVGSSLGTRNILFAQ